ncbi:hypothetical protein [Paenimyroides baculatum]|uniref:Uncharacterized protein n=1 Tax=Paenimyroides baculatum TaxID=2608000 RepID=A0A5M6CQY0_9FLAO|nr:hypothetical protein [Paenimyroides baculatum]KAA5535579.1 hypothetical protein F0460_07305 [Paenimyroides baculatum]
MIKHIYIVLVSLVFLGCKRQDHELSFNIQRQVFLTCNSNPIKNLTIKNDSIKSNNFAVEAGLLIYWNGETSVRIPNELDLSNIPSGYIIRQGGRNYEGNKYFFKPNSSYTIKKFGGGKAGFYLRVWTDSLGKVFKTTHSKCGLKSLHSGEKKANVSEILTE